MEPLSALAFPRNQIRPFENCEVFRNRLTRHFQPFAQISKRLAVLVPQPVEKPPPTRIRQCLEDRVIVHL